jgi:Ca2+-transporting ATPase
VNDAEPAPASHSAPYYGAPTEVALLISALKAGLSPDVERLREVPFSSDRKRMTVVVKGDPAVAYMKGAPEYVLERCDYQLLEGLIKPLDAVQREQILRQNVQFAESAFRVLAFAQKELVDPNVDDEAIESGMVFLGLQGMIDPPRPEVRGAIADCRRAGIRVIMVTGDNMETAKAIGGSIGFSVAGAMTGNELDRLSDSDVQKAAASIDIFARVSPQHKLRLLQALQRDGHRVAMTGDGVNDLHFAPGCRCRHGRRGTSRQAGFRYSAARRYSRRSECDCRGAEFDGIRIHRVSAVPNLERY